MTASCYHCLIKVSIYSRVGTGACFPVNKLTVASNYWKIWISKKQMNKPKKCEWLNWLTSFTIHYWACEKGETRFPVPQAFQDLSITSLLRILITYWASGTVTLRTPQTHPTNQHILVHAVYQDVPLSGTLHSVLI